MKGTIHKNHLDLWTKIAFAVLLTLFVLSFVVPYIWPYSYNTMLGMSGNDSMDASYNNLRPFQFGQTELEQKQKGVYIVPHIFGTDSAGRDYFIRVIYGTRVSLIIGVVASALILFIGVTLGIVSGYFGGIADTVIMRLADIIYSLPDMLLIILLAAVFQETLIPASKQLIRIGGKAIGIFVVLGLFHWCSIARIIRGKVTALREQEYVLAAKALGIRTSHIIKRHILPNCASVICTSGALQIPKAIFMESFLSFVGLGVNAPIPSLGSLINEAMNGISTYPYRIIIPAVFISVIVLIFNIIGNGLRIFFGPRR